MNLIRYADKRKTLFYLYEAVLKFKPLIIHHITYRSLKFRNT